MVFDGELQFPNRRLNFCADVSKVTALNVSHNIEAPGRVVVVDHRLVGAQPDTCNVTETYLTAFGLVHQHVLDAGQAVARLRRSLNDNLEHLLLLEHVADFDALQDGGCGTPHVARLDACLLSLARSTSISATGCSAVASTVGLTTPPVRDRIRGFPLPFPAGWPGPHRTHGPELAVVSCLGRGDLLFRVRGDIGVQAGVARHDFLTSLRTLR